MLHLHCLASLECFAQGFTLGVETGVLQQRGIVRLGNDGTQVAQVHRVEDLLDGVHAVLPLGNTQTWQQLHHQVDQRIGVDLRLAGLDELIVLLIDRTTNRTDATVECLLGQDALFGLQRFEHRRAMNVERT